MKQLLRICRIFLSLGFIFAVSFLFSTQAVFAYSLPSIHRVAHAHVSKHTYTQPIPGVLSASDTPYGEDLYFNEDDEHENGKNLTVSVDNNFLTVHGQSLENSENIPEILFAKQVHADYLLEENSSQKTTTSQ
jgi:hypothetical protein